MKMNNRNMLQKRFLSIVALPESRFLPFDEARAFVHKLQLKSSDDWLTWCARGLRPANIPSNPANHYGKK
eukprot:CAMPEP_0178989914 /NCGR_PEP_ID=MMETSP0795-20121207/4642_1 /TAXON_ID=88552 /ORGANISM="Amoebophrya sp., Strain Ameob2" /LENGTH=69 /DNA_ID=CAMNT_0020681375 /DNA_START=45 /DNA_END=254 /DNA_ORIENTATION=+